MKQPRKSNGRYSHKGIDLLNWKIWVLVATIMFCLLASHYGNKDNTYVVDRSNDVFMKPVVVEPEPTIEDKIREYFPRNWKTMIAIAHAESGMNMNAVGYNCMYNGKSKACKPEDRSKAWSIDCGIMQLNTTAKQCPKETVDQHLKRAADLSRVQGLEAWQAHNNGSYLIYLAEK